MLLEPNQKYIAYVETSKHYLNDPKHMLNNDLHTMMRHGGLEDVIWFLKHYKFEKPVEKAKAWYEVYKDIKVYDFVNPNTYINKTLFELPARCQETHRKFEREYENSKPVWDWWQWALGYEYDPKKYRLKVA